MISNPPNDGNRYWVKLDEYFCRITNSSSQRISHISKMTVKLLSGTLNPTTTQSPSIITNLLLHLHLLTTTHYTCTSMMPWYSVNSLKLFHHHLCHHHQFTTAAIINVIIITQVICDTDVLKSHAHFHFTTSRLLYTALKCCQWQLTPYCLTVCTSNWLHYQTVECIQSLVPYWNYSQ